MPEHVGIGEMSCGEGEDGGLEVTVRQLMVMAREKLAMNTTLSNASLYLQTLRGIKPYVKVETHEAYLRDYLELMKKVKEPVPKGERRRWGIL